MASLVEKIAKFHDMQEFRSHHWTGTFEEYLNSLSKIPRSHVMLMSAFTI